MTNLMKEFGISIEDYTGEEHFRRMNNLKKIDKEAYYHWRHVLTNNAK